MSDFYVENAMFLRNVNPTHWTTKRHSRGDHDTNFHHSENPSSYIVCVPWIGNPWLGSKLNTQELRDRQTLAPPNGALILGSPFYLKMEIESASETTCS